MQAVIGVYQERHFLFTQEKAMEQGVFEVAFLWRACCWGGPVAGCFAGRCGWLFCPGRRKRFSLRDEFNTGVHG